MQANNISEYVKSMNALNLTGTPNNTQSIGVVLDSAKSSSSLTDSEKQAEQDETKGVCLEISQEAMNTFKEELEQMRKQSKEGAEAALDFAKIMEIARRISNGDKVPPSDEKKLLEYSSEMYQMAKTAAMAHQNDKKRKEYDALFEEEDDQRKECEKAMSAEGLQKLETSAEIGFEGCGVII